MRCRSSFHNIDIKGWRRGIDNSKPIYAEELVGYAQPDRHEAVGSGEHWLNRMLGGGGAVAMMPSMSKYAGEQVLVVPRALFDGIGSFQGIRTDGIEAAVKALLDPASHFFIDRAAAEEDPGHKQLIPYCIFRHGSKVLHYTRGKSGGESRLHAQISVGVGGHVNLIDTIGGRTGSAAYHAAVSREIDEELVIDGGYQHRIIALLNDDSNPVGQVHLGIVHLIDLDNDRVSAREEALSELQFSELSLLNGDSFERLETWSRFCIRHLAENPTA